MGDQLTGAQVLSLIFGSAVVQQVVVWLLSRRDKKDAATQQQSVAQMDDDAKMRAELWTEVTQLRAAIETQNARTNELVRLNGELTGKNIAQQSQIETLIQRLTAVTLDRDMNAKLVHQLETKVDSLERQVEQLRSRRQPKPGGTT